MSQKVGTAVLEFIVDPSGVDKGLKTIEGSVDASGKKIAATFSGLASKGLADFGKNLQDAGKMLTPVSVGLAGMGAAILAVGVSFDSAFDTIRLATGATGDALEDLKGSFRTVLANVPDDADKVATALSEVNRRLGLTGKPLEDLTTQILTLSRLTKTDINELIPAATRVFGDWQVATEKQGQTLDYLYKVSQSTGVGVGVLMQKVVESGPAMKALGFSLEQSAAMLGLWEKSGANVDTMLAGLQKAATSFAKANIPVADGLKTVVGKMLALGPGTESAKLATQVFGKAAIGMADAIFKGQLNVDALVASLNKSKETIKGAAADTDDFAENWGKFKNQLLLALEPLGGRLFQIINSLMPLFEGLIGHVSDAVKWFGQLPESIQMTALALGGLGAMAGPGLYAIGTLVLQLPKVAAGIDAMRVALVALSSNPYVLAITALAAAFVVLKGEIDKAKANVANLEARQRSATDATAKYIEKTDGLGNALIDLNHLTDQQRATIAGAAGSVTGLGIAIDLTGGKAKGAAVDIGALTGAQERTKKAADEAAKTEREYAESVQAVRDALKELGIITSGTVNEQMGEFQKTISLGLAGGASFSKVIGQILPKMIAFADAAEQSGANVDDLRDAVGQFQTILSATAPNLNRFVTAFDPTKPVAGMKAITAETYRAQVQAQQTAEAFSYFGLQLPADLKQAADTAMREFIALAQSGKATSQQIADAWKKAQEIITGAAKTAKTTWQDALQGFSSGFQQLAQIAGDAMFGMSRAVGTGIASIEQLSRSLDSLGSGASKATMAAGLMSGAAAVFAFPAFGAKLVEALQTPEWKKAMRDVGTNWGVEIGEGLAKKIEQDQNKITGPLQVGRGGPQGISGEQINKTRDDARQLAELLNINNIIEDSGGLTSATMDDWIERARPLFDVIAEGGKQAGDATSAVSDLLQTFGAQATKTGGLWSASFLSMIAQAKELGVGLDTINGLIADQLATVASSAAKVTGGLTGVLATPGKSLDDLASQQKDQTDHGDLSGAEETAKQIKDLTTKTVTELQPEFDRLNRITLASFNAYIANGHSAVEAIAAVGPAFDSLKAAADKFGFAGSDAFNQLSRWRDLTTQNQPLLDQVSGLNELMSALANTGSLDAATFADLQAQGVATFGQLTAAGFTQNEALAQMAPMLQTIKDLHDKNGLAIDDSTQKLLDQAEAQGVVKEKEESTQSVLKEGLGALLKALGVDLPDAWKKAGKAGSDAAADINKGLKDIKAPPIDLQVRWPDMTPPGEGNGGGGGGSPNPQFDQPQPGFRWGTPNLDYAAFRAAGQPIIAHGDEAIIPRASGHELAGDIAAALGGMVGGTTINNHLSGIDGPSIQRLVESRDFADAMDRGARTNTMGLGTTIRAVAL